MQARLAQNSFQNLNHILKAQTYLETQTDQFLKQYSQSKNQQVLLATYGYSYHYMPL